MQLALNAFSNGISAEFENGSGQLKNMSASGLRRFPYVGVMKLCEQSRNQMFCQIIMKLPEQLYLI